MYKLKAFQAEHKELLEKTQYLIDTAEEPTATIVPQEQVVYERVNRNVDTIRAFHKEFNEILTYGLNAAGELFLVDILKRLHLLPSGKDLPNKNYELELYDLLANSKDNLLIRSEIEQEVDNFTGVLTRNLFKICCAILDL